MKDWSPQLKRRLFGLHRGKTADFIRKLKQFQGREAELLREQISAQKKENEALRLEVQKLEEAIAEKRKRDERCELAFSRLADSKKALQTLGEFEAKAIREQAEKKKAEHRKRVEYIEAQSQAYEASFQSLFNELSALVRKVERLDQAAPALDEANPEEASFSEVAASAVHQIIEEAVEAAEEKEQPLTPLEAEAKELAALQNRAKVIQFKLRNIVEQHVQGEVNPEGQGNREDEQQDREQANPQEQERREAKLQEEEVRQESLQEEVQKHELAAASSWGSSSIMAPSRPKKKREVKRVHKSSSFWGDINEYLDGSEDVEDYEAAEREVEAESEFFDSAPKPRANRQPARQQVSTKTVSREEEAPAASGEATSPRAANAPIEERISQESPALTGEIASIRNRYIVGKVAGEPLYGHDGRLIIGKNQRITAKIVQEADKEGKLPDLIIHMVIPALSEDGEE